MAHNGFGPVGYKNADWYQREMAGPVEVVKEGIKNFRCIRCGKKMNYRNGKFGHFYGCSGYPNCKYTLAVP